MCEKNNCDISDFVPVFSEELMGQPGFIAS